MNYEGDFMKVVVVGTGKVGRTIVEQTRLEGHEVIVIDKNTEVIEDMIDELDVIGIVGNGASYDILKEAGVSNADLVIATTDSDEINILACLIAQKIGAEATVARVRSYEYSNQMKLVRDGLGITMPINPESETANEITKILNFPEAIRVDSFAKGNVDLVELYISEGNKLIGESLLSIYQKYQIKVLVCAVVRGEEVIIPTGNFKFQAKDKIYITANSRSTLRTFLTKVGLLESKLKSVMIIGGGKISAYLGKELLKNKFKVKIIEEDYNRCLELSTLLPDATIIHGDGTDQNVLEEEGLEYTDAIVCLTGSDEENIIISMYAGQKNIKKIITKINKPTLVGLMENTSNASVVSTKNITASNIISYIRSVKNKRGSNVITLHKLVNNKVEAIEFLAKNNKKLINIPLKDLKLKHNILIAAIIRKNEVIIPSGNDFIALDDKVIVVTTNQFLNDLNEILE